MPAEVIPASRFMPALYATLCEAVAALPMRPHLHLVRVGEDPASTVYIRHKQVACAKVGMVCSVKHFAENTTAEAIQNHLRMANDDPTISGILLQLPLPAPLQPQAQVLLDAIASEKDVDGLTTANQVALYAGEVPHHLPATPRGMLMYCDAMGLTLAGKQVAVVGQSNLVGKPFAALCERAGAEVSRIDSQTSEAARDHALKCADLVVCAVGKPNLIHGDQLKRGCVFIDVGINRQADGSLVGDGHTESIDAEAAIRTPVPGGVGPFTVLALLMNVLEACQSQKNL